jgi:GNAT superfamily N-acetyltransferase
MQVAGHTVEAMLIREARPADAPPISALASVFFAEDAGVHDSRTDTGWPSRHGLAYYSAVITNVESLVVVAEDGRAAVVAFLVGRVKESNSLRRGAIAAELKSMYVQPQHRGQRVGARLVEAFRDWAKSKQADLLTVTAFAGNHRAQRFYQSAGSTSHTVTLEAAP